MGTELTGKTIAAEAGLVERTVSFTKGCYTGQELVARIDSRGSNVARRLVGVVAPAEPADGEGRGDALARGMTLHAGGGAAGRRSARTTRWPGRSPLRHGAPSSGPGSLSGTCIATSRRRVPSACARVTVWAARIRPASSSCRSWGPQRPTPGPAEAATTAPVPADERRRGRREPALLVAAVAYAVGAASTTAFTWPADVVTAIPIVVLAVLVVVRWPRRPQPQPQPLEARVGHRAAHPLRAWVVLLVAIVAWELAEYVARGSRGAHPTLSSMTDALGRFSR